MISSGVYPNFELKKNNKTWYNIRSCEIIMIPYW